LPVALASLHATGRRVKEFMHRDWLIWTLVGIAAVAAAVLLLMLLPRLSPDARLRRRLRKTHSRIVSKSRQPSVKFSVKSPKE
jgi:hypothetical protein